MQKAARRRATSRTSRAADNAGVVRQASWLVNKTKRFEQARITVRKERASARDPKKDEGERRTHPEQRHEIPNADEHAGAVERRQDHDINVDGLHEHDPARDPAKPRRFSL